MFGSFFFSSRRLHTRWPRDWSSDVCSSDLGTAFKKGGNFIYSKAGFANKATVDALAESGFHAAFPGRGIPKNLLPLFMALPPGAGFHERLHLRVHGQSANPFLYRGFNLTALDHECLGGQFTGIVGLGSLQ